MYLAVQQWILLWWLLINYFVKSDEVDKAKRSALEHGFAHLALLPQILIPAKSSLHANITATSITKSEKTTVGVPLAEVKPVHNLYKEIWVPGHVEHHSYIPAHLHHIYIPQHAILLNQVHTVLAEPLYSARRDTNEFRKHTGGFGVGIDYGGPGAGHGFQIIFNP